MMREMHYINVDLSGACDRASFHERLQESLGLPPWYGRNLDALYDALTEVPVPMHVCFTGWEEFEEEEPAYFGRFMNVLSDVEKELSGSRFVFDRQT